MAFKIRIDAKRKIAVQLVSEVNRGLIDAWLKLQARGVTKSDVAQTLGKDKSFVTRWLGQPRNMTLMTLGELAHALQVPVRIEFGDKSASQAPVVQVRSPTKFYGFGPATEVVARNILH